ncbi:MAG: hypothetical protein AAB970_01555 [Patescibacteria group bacterium]
MIEETGDLPEMLRKALQAGIPVQCRYGKLRHKVGDKSDYQSFLFSRAGYVFFFPRPFVALREGGFEGLKILLSRIFFVLPIYV